MFPDTGDNRRRVFRRRIHRCRRQVCEGIGGKTGHVRTGGCREDKQCMLHKSRQDKNNNREQRDEADRQLHHEAVFGII